MKNGEKVHYKLYKTVVNTKAYFSRFFAKEKNHIKSITFQEDNFIVRSPGFISTIVSYVHALFKNNYIADKPFINESICNSFITVEKVKKEEIGYIFRFESRGFITGMQTFLLDPTDPFPTGFLLK